MSSLRNSLNLPRRHELNTVAEPLCYSAKSEATPTLRVQTDDMTQWVLPWGEFRHGLHQIRECGELLLFTFSNHEVAIYGRNLGRLVEESANFRLSEIHVVVGAYGKAIATEPFIDEIQLHTGATTDDGIERSTGNLTEPQARSDKSN